MCTIKGDRSGHIAKPNVSSVPSGSQIRAAESSVSMLPVSKSSIVSQIDSWPDELPKICSSKYQENLHLGMRAVRHVQSFNYISSNRDASRKTVDVSREELRNVLFSMRDKIDDEISESEKYNSIDSDAINDYIVMIKTKHKLEDASFFVEGRPIINCYEAVCLAFFHMLDENSGTHLELVSIVDDEEFEEKDLKINSSITGKSQSFFGADHILLVVGRNTDSNISDYTSWGKDTVVCDPWAKRVYGVNEFPEEMDLLRSVTGGSTSTEVKFSTEFFNKR